MEGTVQGVGFRPFVYGLATRNNLTGFVCNDTTGVIIEVEGEPLTLEAVLRVLREEPPPLASIERIACEVLPSKGDTAFTIARSQAEEERRALVSPDAPTCGDCLRELFDPKDRRFLYPFINCTNCGPRFTIVQDVPYDRKRTTMSVFPMCPDCFREYEDPRNRRFRAQPNACPECGPRVNLLDRQGQTVAGADPIAAAARLLKEGAIVAVKGLGGYQLASDAFNNMSVARLRKKKHRWDKPFALMTQEMDTLKRLCSVSPEEEALLKSSRCPIVLLKKKEPDQVAVSVAPGQRTLGVMLPYTPLHHILMREVGRELVMTSGNFSDEPIAYKDDDAFRRLKDIADYFLVHNREIHMRTDDSVSRVVMGQELILRRARGYVPRAIVMPTAFVKPILACGAHLKSTFCLGKGSHAFVSHHIGDLENYETLQSFQEGIEHFQNLFEIQPEVVAYDLHPDYLSSRYAHRLEGVTKIGVQHHHAHIASGMAEHGLESGAVIGVAFDGTGYGTDDTIWGGEFLVADYRDFLRAAHLEYVPLPGGEAAIREPWRSAAACLTLAYGKDMEALGIDFVKRLDLKRWRILQTMMDRGLICPLASSMGRLFDAVASLLGIRDAINYEGQAAVELEMIAEETCSESYPWGIAPGDFPIAIGVQELIRAIVEDIRKGKSASHISAKFHNSLVEMIVSVSSLIRQKEGLERVVLSGGVFQNAFLLTRLLPRMESCGFHLYVPKKVPPNDGGISLGQAAIANARIS